MPDKLLTSAQCDAFMEAHRMISVIYRTYCDNTKWQAYKLGCLSDALESYNTREEAITAYWRKYHPNWQPPEIHDDQWALLYIKNHNLHINRARKPANENERWRAWRTFYNDTCQCGYDEQSLASTLVEAVESWHEKYGEPAELPTTVAMLERCYERLSTYTNDNTQTLKLLKAVIAREKERKDAM